MDSISLFLLFGLAWIVFWFVLGIYLRRNNVADIAWGGIPLYFGGLWYIHEDSVGLGGKIVLALMFIWGIRLIIHIGTRFLKETKEDPRYAIWRASWKYFKLRSFFQVYFLQTLLGIVLLIPLFLSRDHISLGIWNFLGIGLAIKGILLETIADIQLQKFLKMKKLGLRGERYFQGGLWGLSRHPNYLGEILFWWGLFLVSLHNFESLLGILAPLCITFLLLFVSGIPLAEKGKSTDKEWQDYARKTPKLFPNLLTILLWGKRKR